MAKTALVDWYDTPRWYDLVFEPGTRREGSFLVALARRHGRGEPRRVLEPACGSGRLVVDLALFFQQAKHAVQVGQALLDFAVNHAQKIQRDIELDHEGIDHHQVAQSHAPFHHALCGAPQHGDQGHRNDQLLPGVEQAQAGLCFQAGAAQLIEAAVVAFGLKTLVVEILDGFVIQQRIHRFGVGSRVKFVGLASKLGTPLGHIDGEKNITHQCCQSDERKPHIKCPAQDGQHQHHLDQGGDDAVERIRDQRLDAAHTALNVARHATGLPLQVKTQAQAVQMLEGLQSDLTGRTLGGLGKHQLAQFGESRHRQPQHTIDHQQRHRNHQQGLGLGWVGRHRVDQVLEQNRHAHIRQLGPDHE